jgi:hypothetical protein
MSHDLLIRNLAIKDPQMFINTYKPLVIFDEVQYVPSLFSYIKIKVDENRDKYGSYILTGSQIFQMMTNVSESLAGRVAIFQLYPMSFSELKNVDIYDERAVINQILKGFYPELQIHENLEKDFWHSSYLSTYIEKDLKSLRNIQNLNTFQRFLVLLASRVGQLLNLNEIAKECSISQTTAKDWLNLLISSSIVYLLEPYFKNMTKRIVKSPKLYFVDTGVLCYILRISSLDQFMHSPFASHIFENMVIMEKVKQFANKGQRAPIYFYRTVSGLEIDIIVDKGNFLEAYEIKFSSTPKKNMISSLENFLKEHNNSKGALLTLRTGNLPLSENIKSQHFSNIIFNE